MGSFTGKPGGSQWGNRALYAVHPGGPDEPTVVFYGDGWSTGSPPDWSDPDENGVRRWVGLAGPGVVWEWEFHPVDFGRLGGKVFYREDLGYLWNFVTDEEMKPVSWMPQRPGINNWCKWWFVKMPFKRRKDGQPRANARRSVRVHVVMLQPLQPGMIAWHAAGKTYQVWPPHFHTP